MKDTRRVDNLNYNKLLFGKIAVITSGAHGMGKGIAKLFALHGATCVINGLSSSGEETAKMLREISPKSCFIKCDMSDYNQTKNFIDKTLEKFDNIDIVVNNVGVNKVSYIDNIIDEEFEYTQQVNLHGAIRTARGFLPTMMKTGGCFIHISTIQSLCGVPMSCAYATSKSALNALSVGLATEYGKFGIRSNVITPGGVYTSRSEETFMSIKDNDEELLKISEGASIGQPDYGAGSAKDIANASLFLASDMARHITGALIVQDGGACFQAENFRNTRIPPDSDELWVKFMRDRY